jgi:hypothetical protein
VTASKDYFDNHNQKPQVFVWSAPVDRVLSKIAKCKEALDAVHTRELPFVRGCTEPCTPIPFGECRT